MIKLKLNCISVRRLRRAYLCQVSPVRPRRLFSSKNMNITTKYLCVAEKNDAAKNIAAILSRGNSHRRESYSPFNKIYEFTCDLRGNATQMVMTSVSGHMLTYEFGGHYTNWRSCNPAELFDAPVHKVCPEDYKKVKKTLQTEIRRCNGLILWTDCDREGENIGFEIIQVCSEMKANLVIYRAKFSEITPRSIWRALDALGAPDKNVSDAVDVRSEMDLRTGAAFTRLQTLRLQKVFPNVLDQKIISYGSCQFPTLGFVVERYKAKENFIPEQFWHIIMSHTIDKLTTHFTWKRNRLFDENGVLALLDLCLLAGQARITSVESKPKNKWRPLPLDTVEMEKIVSRKLRIDAKQVMKIAEKLYSQGYISYPRTETNAFPANMDLKPLVEIQRQAPDWGLFATRIIDEGGPLPRQGKKSDQAHPPIHPIKYVNTLTGNEQRLYEFIVRHFLACVSKDAKGHETIVDADIGNEKFTAKGLVILERNYLDVYIYESWSGKEIHQYQVGDTFAPTVLELGEGKTSPPKLLTEADLIALMEKHGIGTDATHAEHIETIKNRQYVILEQNMYFVPAALGMGLVEGYNKMELEISLAKPNLRSEFESDLKHICEGRKRPDIVLHEQIAKYRQVFLTIAGNMPIIDNAIGERLHYRPQAFEEHELHGRDHKPVLKCPKCGADMRVRQRPNGGWYLGCANFPQCKNAGWFAGGINTIDVTDECCSQCGPNVKKLKINFKAGENPFVGQQNPLVICVGGCDIAALSTLDVPPSVVKNETQQGRQGASSAWTGASSSNMPFVRIPNDRQNSRRVPAAVQQRVTNTTTYPIRNSVNDQENIDSRSNQQVPNFQRRRRLPLPTTDQENKCNCNKPATLLTCHKGPNAGRQFYKCPENTANGGGCGYFVWSDAVPNLQQNNTNAAATATATASGHNTQMLNGGGGGAGTADEGEVVVCNCDEPAIVRTVGKEGPNKGRKFYSCFKPVSDSCGYFHWKDDDADTQKFRGEKQKFHKRGGGQGQGHSSKRAKRKCGICKQEGHTRANCPQNDNALV